jgi:hypothetical protein
MGDVKRYVQKRNRDHELVLSPVDGTEFIQFTQYILAADYDALAAENARLREHLRWLDRWLGHKPMTECSARISAALKESGK